MKTMWVVLAVVAVSAGAFAKGEFNATEIIRAGETRVRGRSTQAVLSMLIKKPGLNRRLKLRSWTTDGSRALVQILEPTKEEGISSLRVDNEMWNYLPKADQVVRVPTSLMLQSWMGSDFTNDDLMKSSSLVRDYNHKILRTASINGQKAIVIECIPKPNAPVVWGKIEYVARLKDKLPLRESYFDEKGAWIRTLNFDRFAKMDDRVIPTRVRVQVAESKLQHTTIVYEKILYDRAIDPTIFDKDLLRRSVQRGRSLASGWDKRHLSKQATN